MSSAYETERKAALEAVRQASILCRRVQQRMVGADTMTKDDRSPVTVADFGSQALVCRRLRESFPEDRIVGEETGDALRGDAGELRERVLSEVREERPGVADETILEWIDHACDGGGSGRFWALDPIDGTKGFLRGQQYAIALGLVEDGEVRLAVLGCPNLPETLGGVSGGTLFVAVRGQGTCMLPLEGSGAGRRVEASPTISPTEARILESVEAAHGDHSTQGRIRSMLSVAADSVRLDSQAKYGVLARGEADVYLRLPSRADYRERIWDQAAGSLVIEEAGGRVTDMHGRRLDFAAGTRLEHNEGVIATNGPLHDAFLEAIRSLGSGADA